MKNLKLIAPLLAVLLSVGCASKTTTLDHSNGQAATATIELPRHITAITVNYEDVVLPFMVGYPYFLSVAEGPVTLKFIYTQNWGRNDRTTELIKSNIMTLAFEATAGKNYTLDFKKPSSTSDPENSENYINNFEAWVVDDNKEHMSASNSGERPKGISLSTKSETTALSGDRISELKRLWGAANPDERKAFMSWVITPTQ